MRLETWFNFRRLVRFGLALCLCLFLEHSGGFASMSFSFANSVGRLLSILIQVYLRPNSAWVRECGLCIHYIGHDDSGKKPNCKDDSKWI